MTTHGYMGRNESLIIPREAAKKAKTEKTHQVCSKFKVLLSIFFDYNDRVCREFLPEGRTVNKEIHLELLRH